MVHESGHKEPLLPLKAQQSAVEVLIQSELDLIHLRPVAFIFLLTLIDSLATVVLFLNALEFQLDFLELLVSGVYVVFLAYDFLLLFQVSLILLIDVVPRLQILQVLIVVLHEVRIDLIELRLQHLHDVIVFSVLKHRFFLG